jgi:transcriptional regulator with XRE-family HTH domain
MRNSQKTLEMEADEAKRRYEDPVFQEEQRQRKLADFRDSSMTATEVFAIRLRETRRARGLTQAELAKRMSAIGNEISATAIARIEACQRGLSLDEAFALTEALQAVPLYMLTPPEDMLVRLSVGLATDGLGLRTWLVSGLEQRSDQPPPAELANELERQEQNELERQEQADEDVARLGRLARLAYALTDAMRIHGEAGNAARKNAALEIVAEVERQKHDRDNAS